MFKQAGRGVAKYLSDWERTGRREGGEGSPRPSKSTQAESSARHRDGMRWDGMGMGAAMNDATLGLPLLRATQLCASIDAC